LRQLDSWRDPIVARAGDRPTYTLTRMDAVSTLHTFSFRFPDHEIASADDFNEIILTLNRDGREWLKLAYNDFKDGCMLPTGTLTAQASRSGRNISFPQVEIGPGSPRQVVFQMPGQSVYRGRVVDDATSKPMAGVYVLPGSPYQQQPDPCSWTPQQWQQLKDRADRYAARDAQSRLWTDAYGEVLQTGADGVFEAPLMPVKGNGIVEFRALVPGYACASARMSSRVLYDPDFGTIPQQPQPNAEGVVAVPDIRMLRPEQVYFPRLVFEDENGPVTDPNKLKTISLTIMLEGRGGSRPLDRFLMMRQFMPGVYSASGRWNGRLYTFEEVDLTKARPQMVTFRTHEVRTSRIIYQGEVIHAIRREPIQGAVVL
jgi:hypothetical protein